ncbi:hypothetical protein [Catenovulum sediminis]|uniref:Uncharacterized protein n=1 Tax=Catenovulum sediminis TaxID=1740262 RepID=A0ABV1RHZ2_9ALTE
MEKLFYLTSRHGDFCSSVSWWAKDGNGYTTNINNAHKFKLQEAQKHHDHEIPALPIECDSVDRKSRLRVDHQYLDETKGRPVNDNDLVYSIAPQCFDGNDVKFCNDGFGSFNLDEAVAVTFKKALESKAKDTLWLKSHIDSIARPTFQRANLHKQSMCSKFDVKVRKSKRKRTTTGKTRFNCGFCSKFIWEFGHPDMTFYCSWECEHKAGAL